MERLLIDMPVMLIVIGFGLTVMTFILNRFDNINLSYGLQLFVMAFGAGLLLLFRLIIKGTRLEQKLWIENKIINFLTLNNLYDEVAHPTKQGKKLLESSASISYSLNEDDGVFKVRTLKSGKAQYDRFMNDSSDLLVSTFGMDLWHIIDTNNYREFHLLLENMPRLILTSNNNDSYSVFDRDMNLITTSSVGQVPLAERITWNYRDNPHALIAGGTGTGKTIFIFYLIRCLLEQRSDLFIIDPKRSDLGATMKDLIGSDRVAETSGQIAGLLRQANDLMNERYESFITYDNYREGNDFADYGVPPLFIVFDEVAAAMSEASKDIASEIDSYMKQIVMKGRQAGVFMILTTQQPNAKTISTDIRDQLGLRVGLGTLSNEAERMVFGSFDSDLTSSVEKGGGHVFLDGQGWLEPRKFTTPYVNMLEYDFKDDVRKILNR